MNSAIHQSANNTLSSATTSLRNQYIELVDALGILNRCRSRAFDGVAAFSRPEEYGSMRPFYLLRAQAIKQAEFAGFALENFATAQRLEVLEIAVVNMEASRLISVAATRFAFDKIGDVNYTLDSLGRLVSLARTSRSSATDDRYVLLINVLAALQQHFGRGFDGTAAYCWPDRHTTMAPFYELADKAREQMSFARKALQTFITTQQVEVLDVAHANLIAGRENALASLGFAIEKRGAVNFNNVYWRELGLLLVDGEWSIK